MEQLDFLLIFKPPSIQEELKMNSSQPVCSNNAMAATIIMISDQINHETVAL